MRRGEEREEELAEIFLEHIGKHKFKNKNLKLKKRDQYDDIDFEVHESGTGKTMFYFEIKERSCTLNAYKHTKFPFKKIEKGKELINKDGVDVSIILKFSDCWAEEKIDIGKEYIKESKHFKPNYRNEENIDKESQMPVKIDIHELKIINL